MCSCFVSGLEYSLPHPAALQNAYGYKALPNCVGEPAPLAMRIAGVLSDCYAKTPWAKQDVARGVVERVQPSPRL